MKEQYEVNQMNDVIFFFLDFSNLALQDFRGLDLWTETFFFYLTSF